MRSIWKIISIPIISIIITIIIIISIPISLPVARCCAKSIRKIKRALAGGRYLKKFWYLKPSQECTQQLPKVSWRSDEQCSNAYRTDIQTDIHSFVNMTPPWGGAILKKMLYLKPSQECTQQLLKVSWGSDEQCSNAYRTDRQTHRTTYIRFYIYRWALV